ISNDSQALHKQVQKLLEKTNSNLQFFELVGKQWPTDPSSPAYDVNQNNDANPPVLPEAVTNKSGGKPTPVWLTNMVMETYFQGASTGGTDQSLYNVEIANEQAWNQIQGFKTHGTNTDRIFGTESCIGCHFSSSIATSISIDKTTQVKTANYDIPGSADFSWLIQNKVQFKK
ncbi:MAG: hypothetical protein MJK11_18990, partial [Pseudomonadales bacterium]|nr:hypothetical protein [Pseudomonadales bacterium]